MRIIFLDIDGVLNNGNAAGVFHESSTIPYCVEVLNYILEKSGAKIVLISSWKDAFDFEVIKKLLYNRGIKPKSIVACTEKDVQKEPGMTKFIKDNKSKIESFVIIDNDINFINGDFEDFVIRTNTKTGITEEEIELVLEKIL
jgi:hypothetical protein